MHQLSNREQWYPPYKELSLCLQSVIIMKYHFKHSRSSFYPSSAQATTGYLSNPSYMDLAFRRGTVIFYVVISNLIDNHTGLVSDTEKIKALCTLSKV